MTTGLGEGKLWIQTSCWPEERWASLGYSYMSSIPMIKPGYGMNLVLIMSEAATWATFTEYSNNFAKTLWWSRCLAQGSLSSGIRDIKIRMGPKLRS